MRPIMGLFLSPSCIPRSLGAGSPPVTKKTVTKVGQPRTESTALESHAIRPHVPLCKKESKNKFKSLDFELQESNQLALAGWLTWLEHCPMHQKVEGSIPSQGRCLACRFDFLVGVGIGSD
uniref:Uncharacterized protein n=1 Tax=Myotis myotis TaxID=51298 RepID=A0A7J7YEN3_MYOMY|nr:hypothetical protein mMyoMyo1_011044 [Myotis myotis]